MNTQNMSLADCVLSTIQPNPELGIRHQGNWPVDAVFGVSYKLFDKQFPNVDHHTNVVYFENQSKLDQWLDEKREWVKGTDYDFSMSYSVYEWDLGPNFRYYAQL